MCYVSVKLDNLSLGFFRRLTHIILLQPPYPHLHLKLIYNVVLMGYLALISRWRHAFNYNVIYDYRNDYLSRIIDLINFDLLIVGHLIVALEMIWKNRSERIDQQMLRIQGVLCEQFHRKMNYHRMRVYSGVIYGSLFLRVTVLLTMTIYNYLVTDTSLLLICNFYSELVIIVRCSDFSMHVALVLAVYYELMEASSQIILQLDGQMPLSLRRIKTLQELHHVLWTTHREIEKSFWQSLLVVLLKYFVDTSVMPYWVFLAERRLGHGPMQTWCISEEFGKVLEICIPCWFCTQCALLQRQFRSLLHDISINRHNMQLNNALCRITSQLGQENSRFCLGGFVAINNELLGKFLFGVTSYIVICIQFRLSFLEESAAEEELHMRDNQTRIT